MLNMDGARSRQDGGYRMDGTGDPKLSIIEALEAVSQGWKDGAFTDEVYLHVLM
jgi:hypothetical protein